MGFSHVEHLKISASHMPGNQMCDLVADFTEFYWNPIIVSHTMLAFNKAAGIVFHAKKFNVFLFTKS